MDRNREEVVGFFDDTWDQELTSAMAVSALNPVREPLFSWNRWSMEDDFEYHPRRPVERVQSHRLVDGKLLGELNKEDDDVRGSEVS
jgi:hypothetical protein